MTWEQDRKGRVPSDAWTIDATKYDRANDSAYYGGEDLTISAALMTANLHVDCEGKWQIGMGFSNR